MEYVPEPQNRFDHFAVAVKAPGLQNVPNNLLSREARSHPRQQFVRDIIGETIGICLNTYAI